MMRNVYQLPPAWLESVPVRKALKRKVQIIIILPSSVPVDIDTKKVVKIHPKLNG